MKNYFPGFIFILALWCLHIKAQPVLQENALAAAGTISGSLLGGATVTPGDPGINQTWDFSDVMLSPFYTVKYVDPSVTPFSNSFPASNYCYELDTSGVGSQFTYYLRSTDKLETLGDNINSAGGNDYTPNPRTELEFPFNYLDFFTDDWQRTDGASGSVIVLYDAFGTLLTPFGAFDSVVRINYNNDATQEYIWYNTNPIYPIWRYSGSVSVAIDLNPVGITNQGENDLVTTVFPVPAHDELNIRFNHPVNINETSIHLYTVLGTEIHTYSTRIENPQLISLNLQHVPKGIFQLDIEVAKQHVFRRIVVD